MTADELFRTGQLQQAIDEQIKSVKASPADHARRLFLFELLAFAGDLERARRQIEAVRYEEIELESAVQSYRKLLDAEQARRRVFQEGIMPQFLIKPPEHLGKRLEAVNALRAGRPAEAVTLLAEASQAAPEIRGTLNDKPFDDLRDCDDLFGPTLEVMAHGDYYWLPLEQVEVVSANAPRFPRDLLWFPVRLEVRDGPAGDVFLPVLYSGSHEHTDDRIRLGRLTDWQSQEGGPVRGVGLRQFLAGEEPSGLPEWRELRIS
jgi:type VI secretion system protein ImpE